MKQFKPDPWVQKETEVRIMFRKEGKDSRTKNLAMITAILTSTSFAGTALAAPAGITPGVWMGGNPSNNTPYFTCLNVSADGQRLTAYNTQCRGNQGQDQNSISINFQSGQTPEGAQCNQNSYRDLAFGDIPIADDGTINTIFSNSNVITHIVGRFFPAQNLAMGTVRTQNWNVNCTSGWQARPGALPPINSVPPGAGPAPTAPPATGAITPGLWQGGNTSEDPFFACLNVAPEGNRLTANGTQCRGNQGQNQNSIDIQFNGGTTPNGQRCNEYSYRNLDYGDITINPDGTFSTNFTNAWVNTTITGQFSGASVSGTVRSITPYSNCRIDWTAAPVAAGS